MKSETRSSTLPFNYRKNPRNSSFRSKTLGPRSINATLDAIEDQAQASTHSDNTRLTVLLENLDIRFEECTFTYKDSHFEEIQTSASALKKRSKISSLRHSIFRAFDKVRDAVTCEKTYNKCLFVPVAEKDKVKDFLRENFSEVKLSFEDCKFIKRSATVQEKITRRLRTIFGIQFELEYINSVATVYQYTFRIKDILFVNQHIQERIVKEG